MSILYFTGWSCFFPITYGKPGPNINFQFLLLSLVGFSFTSRNKVDCYHLSSHAWLIVMWEILNRPDHTCSCFDDIIFPPIVIAPDKPTLLSVLFFYASVWSVLSWCNSCFLKLLSWPGFLWKRGHSNSMNLTCLKKFFPFWHVEKHLKIWTLTILQPTHLPLPEHWSGDSCKETRRNTAMHNRQKFLKVKECSLFRGKFKENPQRIEKSFS